MQQKKRRPDPTPMSHKIVMAVVAVLLLLVSIYFLNGQRFPSDITFKRVGNTGGSSYVTQRENPYGQLNR